MSYIIIAEVDTRDEDNYCGDVSVVDARVLLDHNGVVKFDIPGDHHNKR